MHQDHDHNHDHDHGHAHSHGGEDHVHAHDHAHGHEHTHEHGHLHEHTHEHEHKDSGSHAHAHTHEHVHPHAHNPGHSEFDKVLALMNYMLEHNRQHTEELDQMVKKLEALGKNASASLLQESVKLFSQGNDKLAASLEAIKEG